MKIAIGGSRSLPRGTATRVLVRFLAQLAPGTTIMLRKGIETEPGQFELDVVELCELLHLPVEWRTPQVTDRHKGRATVFIRDWDMVEDADLVLCFVDDTAEEYSGTTHLLERAFESDRPVYGYWVSDGLITRWGENDPNEEWVDMVPTPD